LIVGVTGHQSLPPAAVAPVTHRILDALRETGEGLVGMTSLAAGADQIFARAVLELGGRLHVVVPSWEYESAFADDGGRAAYLKLVNRADIVETLPHPQPSSVAFLEAGRRIVDTCALLIAVWDGELPHGSGGTAEVVQYARERGSKMVVVWPKGVAR
jgi:hypothetical protein